MTSGAPQDLRVARRAAVLVVAGLVVVAIAAFALNSSGVQDESGATFGTLVAPVTPQDEAIADIARRVKTGLEQADPDDDLGGWRGSGRGWLTQTNRDGYGRSIAAMLGERNVTFADVEPEAGTVGEDFRILIQSCGEAFGVFAESSVLSDEADVAWWSDRDCPGSAQWVLEAPVYFVLGGQNR